jgi:hypothetical protein
MLVKGEYSGGVLYEEQDSRKMMSVADIPPKLGYSKRVHWC